MFNLYDTLLKQIVYTGTQDDCKRVLNDAIKDEYHKDFLIVEAQ